MPIEAAFSGIVLTAQTFNPSIFTENWLDKNGIVPVAMLGGLRISSPEVAQFQAGQAQFLVIPPKMQISFPIEKKGADVELPQNIAKRTIELLPHTPYLALGLNFEYFVIQPSGQEFGRFNHSFFSRPEDELSRELASSDALYGRYYSKNHGIFRLKLDIKPGKAGETKKDVMHFSFNYDCDVSSVTSTEKVAKLLDALSQWGSLKDHALHLVEIGSLIAQEAKRV